MITSPEIVGFPSGTLAVAPRAGASDGVARGLLAQLDDAFGQAFAVVDLSNGVLDRVSSDWPRVDVFRWQSVCEVVARRGCPEVIEEHAPWALLAVPLPRTDDSPAAIAVAVLVTDAVRSIAEIESAARVFGVDPDRAYAWSRSRSPLPPRVALHLAAAIVDRHAAKAALASQKHQLADVSGHLLATFEELSLLHRLTEGLTLGRSAAQLFGQSVEWLSHVLPAESITARWLDDDEAARFDGPSPATDASAGRVLTFGRCPLPTDDLDLFFDRLGNDATKRSLVLNRNRTSSPTWDYPGVREVVCVPIRSDGRLIGWIAGLNYRATRGSIEREFGSVEASLLTSVSALLGVHAGNRRLFRERTELFESSVRAISLALDAKDPYTCGHSDRVARIAVRIAQQMGRPDDELSVVYLAGLLHDVGKIGIDDQVLRKPDKLTDDEYEHIKTHPVLGERILQGVSQLAPVLPIVRHHHEAWDGGGYPDGLAGEATPVLARIMAVADSVDAMRSDRPYRKGMHLEGVEQILREGAGKQWDAAIVEAYFAARDDVAAIGAVEREPLDLDVRRWRRE
ncbi:MAG: HD-GYP domain-containing protein [Lacipirellulaceae bacterium]